MKTEIKIALAAATARTMLLLAGCDQDNGNANATSGQATPPAKTMLASDTKAADELMEKAHALAQQGKEEESMAAYDEATRVAPGYAKAWFNKGYAIACAGSDSRAIPAYERALLLDPNNGKTWAFKGACLMRLGRTAEGVECARKARELGYTPENFGPISRSIPQ